MKYITIIIAIIYLTSLSYALDFTLNIKCDYLSINNSYICKNIRIYHGNYIKKSDRIIKSGLWHIEVKPLNYKYYFDPYIHPTEGKNIRIFTPHLSFYIPLEESSKYFYLYDSNNNLIYYLDISNYSKSINNTKSKKIQYDLIKSSENVSEKEDSSYTLIYITFSLIIILITIVIILKIKRDDNERSQIY